MQTVLHWEAKKGQVGSEFLASGTKGQRVQLKWLGCVLRNSCLVAPCTKLLEVAGPHVCIHQCAQVPQKDESTHKEENNVITAPLTRGAAHLMCCSCCEHAASSLAPLAAAVAASLSAMSSSSIKAPCSTRPTPNRTKASHRVIMVPM